MCLGIPGQIIALSETDPSMGTVDVSGVRRQVNLACVIPEGQSAETLIGQWVLIHVGFAMSIIDAEEAERTLSILAEMGELAQEQDQMLASNFTEDAKQ